MKQRKHIEDSLVFSLVIGVAHWPFVCINFQGAEANSGEGVRLAKNNSDKVNLKEVKTVLDCIPVASNPEIVADMEDLASTWCKQIEQVRLSINQNVCIFSENQWSYDNFGIGKKINVQWILIITFSTFFKKK